MELLKSSNMDAWNFPDVTCCDSSVKTILVSYNDKYKRFESVTPPTEADPVITFLMNLSTTVVLPRYKGIIDFEQ
jgi:hypothetical protein